MYQAQRLSRSEYLPIRQCQYHVRHWGTPRQGQAPLVMLHGWMDVSASFQFVVDAMQQERWIIAPDWRGYGLSTGPSTDSYWFPDFLADLDALLDHYAGDQAIDLVGHSMGGNVAMLYSGVRPDRIRRLVNLEGFGLPAAKASHAPRRYAQWLDEVKALSRGDISLPQYDNADGVAAKLMKNNPRLSADKAQWLAQHWAAPNAQGRWAILGDPAHRVVNAQLYRVDEVQACYHNITAPVLSVVASDDSLQRWWKEKYTLAEYHERLKAIAHLHSAYVEEASHMLHHDQPAQVARLMEDFLRE